MTSRHRKVATSEAVDDQERINKKDKAERIEKLVAKLHGLFWIGISALIIHYTDFFVLLVSDKINRWAFNLSIISLTVIMSIFLYLGFWLPVIMKNHIPWEVYCPNMIPIATGASVVWFISLIVTFWPVWGLLSPLLVGFLVMGVVFLTHFIPWPF